ncbi:acyltransferase [Deinococcus ficus]|uniref:Acyltransferase n=1 Tax=Deinococcus ficus TaxID=317577 RepID=A0A221T256_9DEIO|nr:DapH/DapD/GlmU-related protein [Deinococcus ficus]ASN82941.1 hypothetical protein DFI_17290 [Deinococcus ficus]
MSRVKFLAAQRLIAQLPATRMFEQKRQLLRWAGVQVGGGTRIHSGAHFDTAHVVLGEDIWIGGGVFIGGNPGAPVVIEDNVDIAPRVMIITGSHEVGGATRRAGPGFSKGVTIGRGSWLGAGSLVMPGVTLGPGSIVAAGSVVTKDVPPNSLVAGVPARLVRALEE